MEAQTEPSSGGYALTLLCLGLGLGVLTVRVRYQQKLEERNAGAEIVVTKDFKGFQATFMSEHGRVSEYGLGGVGWGGVGWGGGLFCECM